ncbi:MAG: hypothetical protein ABR597_03345 [Bacteroidales bacterium]
MAKKITVILITALMLSSCITTKVQVNSKYPGVIPIDTLNLVSVVYGPVVQPVIPLIDAAAFNGRTNKISDQILEEQKGMTEVYKKILLRNLNNRVTTYIKTGDYFTDETAQPYKAKEGILIDNKNFPVVWFDGEGMNLWDYGKGTNVRAIFESDPQLKSRIAKFAREMNINNVLVSFNRLAVIGVGMFGSTGNIRLESYLYLYDANGNLMMDAYGWTKPSSIGGRELYEYQAQMDKFEELVVLLSNELVKHIR